MNDRDASMSGKHGAWARVWKVARVVTLGVSLLLVLACAVGWGMSWGEAAAVSWWSDEDVARWDKAAAYNTSRKRGDAVRMAFLGPQWTLAQHQGAVCLFRGRGAELPGYDDSRSPPRGLVWTSPVPERSLPLNLINMTGIERWSHWRIGAFAMRWERGTAVGCEVFVRLPYWFVMAVCGLPWMVVGVCAFRRRLAARRGRCVKCGYDLRGLGVGAICPECGNERVMGRGA